MRIGLLIATLAAFLVLVPRARATPPQESNPVTSTVIDSILKQLADPRRTVRDTARAALEKLDGKIAVADRITLLRAAGGPFLKEAGEDDTPNAIIARCDPDPALVPVAKNIFPNLSLTARFLTKEAMARSDMVEWLVFPTELAREPDEIELMKIVPVDTEKEPADLYIFRFRTTGDYWATKHG